MQVLLTPEAKETSAGSYHVFAEDEGRSLCGSVNTESAFASRVERVLPREPGGETGIRHLRAMCGDCRPVGPLT